MSNLAEKLLRYDEREAARRPPHPIPALQGCAGWKQPERSRIQVDAEHALMDRRTFEELMEYSGTFPSGVCIGKMWRRHDGIFDQRFRASGGRPIWMLCWYGESDRPGFVSNHRRTIILSDGDLPEAKPWP